MILTKEQVEERINSEKNIANKIESHNKVIIKKDGINNPEGRKEGTKNLTENERVAVGVLANTVGDEMAAELMGVAVTTAHCLKTANVRSHPSSDITRSTKDVNLQKKINERLEATKLSIQERAAEKLIRTLGLITDDKLENCNAKELADVTTKMSQVVRNLGSSSPNDRNGNSGAKVQIVLHQPKEAREESFDVIEVGVG